MPTPFESAQLNLKLYELRREPVLREARNWFLQDFNPESMQEFSALVAGENNARFRMVLSYWEMACSLVSTGAIDRTSFLAANGEVVGTFGKVVPFLEPLRAATGEPAFCEQLEQVLLADETTRTTMDRRREKLLLISKARAAAPKIS